MSNHARGESEFLAGAERFVMRLTLGALAEIENGLGIKSLGDIGERLKTLATNDLAIVASALLRGAGFNLSPAEVLKLETDLGTLMRAIAGCFEGAGLSSPVHGGGVERSEARGSVFAKASETEGAHASPLAGTSSSPSRSA